MADYILLEQSEKNNLITIIVHSEVPNGNNESGVTWKEALIGSTDTTSRVPPNFLPSTRQAALGAGDFYEWSFTFQDDANATRQTRLANIEAEITRREAAELERMSNRLRFFGRIGSA